jgi:hypothetical protein
MDGPGLSRGNAVMTSNWYGDELLARYHQATLTGITKGIALVETEAVRLITDGPKTGAIYSTFFFTTGSGPGRTVIPYGSRPPHQASAPGEPPASDTGFLVANRTINIDSDQLIASLSFHAGYAFFLEYGTDRMEPRPFARPALANTWGAVVDAIKAEYTKLAA